MAFAQEKQQISGKIVDAQKTMPFLMPSISFSNKTVKENAALLDATLTDEKRKLLPLTLFLETTKSPLML